MDPVTISAILTGGSMAGNFLGAYAEEKRRKDLQRQLMELLNPERLGSETNALFDMFRNSPMYSGLRNRAMTASSALGNQLQSSFAQRGLSRSGIAGMAMPIARSSFQQGFQDIDADMFMKALLGAKENLSQRANILTGTQGPGWLAGGAGKSLDAFMPLILAYLSKQGGMTLPGGKPAGQQGYA